MDSMEPTNATLRHLTSMQFVPSGLIELDLTTRAVQGSSMGLFPAFALSDEVAANHHDNATNHDDICPDVVRGGPKSQHCPQEDVHRTQAE
jgi:hypothetical protein